jgi:hypothetical protein
VRKVDFKLKTRRFNQDEKTLSAKSVRRRAKGPRVVVLASYMVNEHADTRHILYCREERGRESKRQPGARGELKDVDSVPQAEELLVSNVRTVLNSTQRIRIGTRMLGPS